MERLLLSRSELLSRLNTLDSVLRNVQKRVDALYDNNARITCMEKRLDQLEHDLLHLKNWRDYAINHGNCPCSKP